MITQAYEDPAGRKEGGAQVAAPRVPTPDGSGESRAATVEESPAGPVVRGPGTAGFTVLYLHGDPYAGAPEPVPGFARRLALRTGADVLCPRHRPEFPGALDDVESAYDHSRAAGPVVVAGTRLGAGLAAALLVRLRDSDAMPPRCAALVAPLLDLTLGAPSLLLNSGAYPGFDTDELRRQVTRYVGGTSLTDPLLSPLYANLHGLPPIQILATGNDPLLDDSLAFAARAARSGVHVDLRVRPDAADLRGAVVADLTAFAEGWTSVARPPHTA